MRGEARNREIQGRNSGNRRALASDGKDAYPSFQARLCEQNRGGCVSASQLGLPPRRHHSPLGLGSNRRLWGTQSMQFRPVLAFMAIALPPLLGGTAFATEAEIKKEQLSTGSILTTRTKEETLASCMALW